MWKINALAKGNHYDYNRDLTNFLDDFWFMSNKNFEKLFDTMSLTDISSLFPKIYRKDNDGNTIAELEVPGFSKEDLTISIEEDHNRASYILVKGETKNKRNIKYMIPLEGSTDVDTIHAECQNGLLTLTWKQLKKTRKTIDVK